MGRRSFWRWFVGSRSLTTMRASWLKVERLGNGEVALHIGHDQSYEIVGYSLLFLDVR